MWANTHTHSVISTAEKGLGTCCPLCHAASPLFLKASDSSLPPDEVVCFGQIQSLTPSSLLPPFVSSSSSSSWCWSHWSVKGWRAQEGIKKESPTAYFRRNSPTPDAVQAPHGCHLPSPPHTHSSKLTKCQHHPPTRSRYRAPEHKGGLAGMCTHQLPWGTDGCSPIPAPLHIHPHKPHLPDLPPPSTSSVCKHTYRDISLPVGSLAPWGHAQQEVDAFIREGQQCLQGLDHTVATPSYIPLLFALPHSQLPLWPSSLSSSFSSPFCSAPLVVGWQGMAGSQPPHFHSPTLASSVRGTHCQTCHLPKELK